LNHHYIKELPNAELVAALIPFLSRETSQSVTPSSGLSQLVELQRERGKTLVEMARLSRWYASDAIEYEHKAVKKQLKPGIRGPLQDLHDMLAGLSTWSDESVKNCFDAVLARHGDLKMGKLAQPVRVALTGGTVSPGIFETLTVLGKPRSIERIAAALELIPSA
ncbi:MAG: glutamate--tRNA ligase, partial [Myxococcota bacterium]